MATILQPSLSHREVASGPRKNIMPVARDPTQAKKGEIIYLSLMKFYFHMVTGTRAL